MNACVYWWFVWRRLDIAPTDDHQIPFEVSSLVLEKTFWFPNRIL